MHDTLWVRHDLTDAGWQLRLLGRLFLQLLPVPIILALLPGLDLTSHVLLCLLPVLAWLLTVPALLDPLRARRLRQHKPPVPRVEAPPGPYGANGPPG